MTANTAAPGPPIRLEVEPALSGLPVLEYLAVLWPDCSKERLRDLFARGAVRSAATGRPVSPDAPAGGASPLDLHAAPESLPRIYLGAKETVGVKVIYQDDRLVALDKPSGLPVIPDRDRGGPSCLGYLIRREQEERGSKSPALYRRPRVVHRIDRLTSGVVIFARTLEAEIQLAGWFERAEVRKEYLAILCGEVAPALVTVNVPLGPGRKGKVRALPGGKPSLTAFEVVERFRGFTLARAKPRTGRMHQIRVHAWAMGHPLAVDPLYRVGPHADHPPPPGISRLTLHAERLVLPEAWGEPREFRAEMPEDFRAAVEALRGGAG